MSEEIINSISKCFTMNVDLEGLKKLEEYITNLQQKVEQLEKENEELKRNCNIGNENLTFYRNQCKQLENIRKEAIKLIKKYQRNDEFLNFNEWQTRDLLNILNKGSDKE